MGIRAQISSVEGRVWCLMPYTQHETSVLWKEKRKRLMWTVSRGKKGICLLFIYWEIESRIACVLRPGLVPPPPSRGRPVVGVGRPRRWPDHSCLLPVATDSFSHRSKIHHTVTLAWIKYKAQVQIVTFVCMNKKFNYLLEIYKLNITFISWLSTPPAWKKKKK